MSGRSIENASSQEDVNQECRTAFVLLDGNGDVSLPQMGNLTPLEAADTPTLDAIAGKLQPSWICSVYEQLASIAEHISCPGAGLNGLMDPVEPGLACGSDTAHLSLFGYDPRL